MKLMDWFKKKNKEEPMATEDEKEIKKAKEDIAEKGKDSQTEKDREDESVGEQERRSGNEDSQNAKDRIDESEGTKRADEKREERKDERRDGDDRVDRLISTMERLLSVMEKNSVKEDKAVADATAAEKAQEVYGLGNGVFQGENKSVPEKKLTTKDVAETINKLL